MNRVGRMLHLPGDDPRTPGRTHVVGAARRERHICKETNR